MPLNWGKGKGWAIKEDFDRVSYKFSGGLNSRLTASNGAVQGKQNSVRKKNRFRRKGRGADAPPQPAKTSDGPYKREEESDREIPL